MAYKQAVSTELATRYEHFTEVQNMNGRLPHLDNAQARDDFDCVYIFRKAGS